MAVMMFVLFSIFEFTDIIKFLALNLDFYNYYFFYDTTDKIRFKLI